MKLGFVSAILADQSFEEIFDFASQNNFNCIEVLCWPKGKAERKYAGVTHIDVNTLDDKTISHIQDYVKRTKVGISSNILLHIAGVLARLFPPGHSS